MRHTRIFVIVVIVGALGTGWWLAASNSMLQNFYRPDAIREIVDDAGFYGPLVVMAFMAAAIVVSPLPSAPIALAAGAAYGHIWGTIYILVGAEIGALIAFGIARVCGRDTVCKLVSNRLPETRFNTQNGLMVVVFVSRLLPFLSFDVISYATGLTQLTTVRFAIATFAGMIPASFLLAHFGAEIRIADWAGVLTALLALAAAMLVPPAVVYVYRRRSHVIKSDRE